MQSETTARKLLGWNNALRSFEKYLELWIKSDTEYSREYIAFMLLASKGKLAMYQKSLESEGGGHIGGGYISELRELTGKLEGIFRRITLNNGNSIRKCLMRALNCSSLMADCNEYLAESKTISNAGKDIGFIELGTEVLLKRDEIQMVLDELDKLESQSNASFVEGGEYSSWRQFIGERLKTLDLMIQRNAKSFSALSEFMKSYREQFGKGVLDPGKYFWWFLEPSQEKPIPSPQEIKKIAREMAKLANAIGSDGGPGEGWRRESDLLRFGQLAYRQLFSSSYPSHWESLAKFAHGALNQAVILLGERADLPQHAEACYSLSLVCRNIAERTGAVTIAEKSLSLLKVASSRAAGKDFASLGLVSLSKGQAEALIEELRERGRGETEDAGLVSAGAAIPVLDPVEVLTWLSSTYGVEPRGKKGLWNRIAAILQQGASMPQAYMRPRLAEALLGAGESVRDEKEGERLGGLCPGMEGLLYWPRDIRPRVWLRLRIEERERLGLVPDKPIQLVLWANVPPPEGLEWADWVIRGNCKPDIGPHQSSVEIPITQEKYPSVDEEQKKIVRNWICQYLVIQPPSQEMPDSR